MTHLAGCDPPWRTHHVFLAIILCFSSLSGVSSSEPVLCYYQEEQVIKECEIFHRAECKNFTPETTPRVVSNYKPGELNGQNYNNVSFENLYTKGFLWKKGSDMCWKYEVDSSLYPDDAVDLYFYFIPISNVQFIGVHEDVEENECDYFIAENKYSFQVYEFEDNKLKFTFRQIRDIKKVHLKLIGGDCEVLCNGSNSGCTTTMDESVMEDFSEPYYFGNLTHRYYCILVRHRDCEVHTHTTEISVKTPPETSSSPQQSNTLGILLPLIAFLTAVGMVLFMMKKMCQFGTPHHQLVHTQEPDMEPQLRHMHERWLENNNPPQIMLLYSRDSPIFCEVVHSLHQLLQKFGNITVLDPLEDPRVEEVSGNISGWLTQHLNNPDVKLVVVLSEGAVLRQEALLKRCIIELTEPHFLDRLFTQALQEMQENPNLGNDYKRVFPIRFEDFTSNEVMLTLIVPLKCYVLLENIGKLILELQGFNTATNPELELEHIRNICPQEVTHLEAAVQKMKEFCADNPSYINNHFSLIMPPP